MRPWVLLLFAACGRMTNDPVDDAGADAKVGADAAPDVHDAMADAIDAACPSGGTWCASLCVDLSTDTHNCGACGHDCEGTKCALGACTSVMWQSVDPVAIALDATNVYFTNRDQGTIERMPKTGGQLPTMIASNQAIPAAIAIDATRLYWSANYDIVSMPLGGNGSSTLTTTKDGLLSLQIDATKIYWGSYVNVGDVGATSLADGTTTILASGRQAPRVGAVDATYLYWSEYGGLMRVPIGGGTIDALATVTVPSVLTVDATHLYWIDPGTVNNQYADARLLQAGLDAQNPITLASNLDGIASTSLAVDATHVYWTFYGSQGAKYLDGYVARVPIGGGTIEKVATKQPYCYGLALDATHLYWIDNYANWPGEIHKLAK